MNIDIWFDFQCPFSYVGEKKLEEALTSPDLPDPVEVRYRAYQLDPDAPVMPVETMTEHFMSTHNLSVAHAEAQMDRITRMAARAGLRINMSGVQVCNTMDAHRLMKFAATRLSPWRLKRLNFRLFEANFFDNLRLSDPVVLTNAAMWAGLDRQEVIAMLESDAYREEVIRDRAELEARPDFEFVPFFQFGNSEGFKVRQGLVSVKGLHSVIRSMM